MEEVYQDKAIDYLNSLKVLGPKQFLALHPCPVLLENYRGLSSKSSLSLLKTVIGEVSGKIGLKSSGVAADRLLEARVIPVEKRETNSPEHLIFVGRSQKNDVVLLNKMVSKLHAYFARIPGRDSFQVVDMNSTNGTFVNGQRVMPSVKTTLEDEDEIAFGPETRMSFFSAAAFCELLQRLA